MRQGRPRRDRHRSGSDRDVRDRDQSEAGERMAPRHDRRQARSPRWTGRCSSPASPTPGPCRSRRASTCSRPASARRSASRCTGPIWPKWRGSRGRSRQLFESAGDHQRLCRARHQRLLPQRRPRPGAARALRAHDQRRPERGRDGARRRARDHHRRRAGALHREHPLSARLSQRPADDSHARC